MEIFDYLNRGGKNVILDYICNLDKRSRDKIIFIRNAIELYGIDAFENINYRKLVDKIYEIKVYNSRFAYTIINNKLYFLHAFKKQKNKTEQKDISTSLSRYDEIKNKEVLCRL